MTSLIYGLGNTGASMCGRACREVERTLRPVCISDSVKLTNQILHSLPHSLRVHLLSLVCRCFLSPPLSCLRNLFKHAHLKVSFTLLFSRPQLPTFKQLLSSQSSHLAPPFPSPIPIPLAHPMVPLNDGPPSLISQVDDPGFYDDTSRQQASATNPTYPNNPMPPRIDPTPRPSF
jgi:hypothetical protein